MEELDRQIVDLLVKDGRMSYTDLGKATGLSTSAVHQRVRRLEQRGVIRGYAALVDPEAVGLPLTAFISVKPFDPSAPDDIADRLAEVPELEACHSVAGDENYILKVRVATPWSWSICSPVYAPSSASRPAPRSCSPRPTRPARRASDGKRPLRAARPSAGAKLSGMSEHLSHPVRQPDSRPVPPRTVLLRGGEVHSPADPFATAMVVEGDRIAWVGEEGAADSFAEGVDEIVQLDGALVTPAFTDTHVHTTATGLALTGLDLVGVGTLSDALARIRDYADARPADRILLGHGWDSRRLAGGRPPSRAELDAAAGGRPLYLTRVDVHSAVVTTALLDLVPGIRDLDGFRDGAPLTGAAHHAVRKAAYATVTPAQRAEAQAAALARAASLGIGSIHECAGPDISGEDDFTGLLALAREGNGPRVVGYWAEAIASAKDAERIRDLGALGAAGDLFADGSLGSHTAHLHAPTRTPRTPAPPSSTPRPSPPMSPPAPRPGSRRASTPSATPPSPASSPVCAPPPTGSAWTVSVPPGTASNMPRCSPSRPSPASPNWP